MLLDNQVALVTGGSRGIGRAISLALGREGAKVVVNYTANPGAAEEVVSLIRDAGGEAFGMRGDVSIRGDAEALVEAALERYGGLDILVNNAGVTRDGLLLRMKDDDWDGVMKVNLGGAFNCTRAAARPMIRKRRGKIVNLASVVGIVGNAGQANYCAAKAGIVGFTKAVARELASRNVNVNAVAPGFILTDMTRALPKGTLDDLAGGVPLGRPGTPDDVAGAVLFLVSPAADYITGQTVVVDGGMTMSAP